MADDTSIRITKKLRDEIANHERKGQSHNDFIRELLFHWKDCPNA